MCTPADVNHYVLIPEMYVGQTYEPETSPPTFNKKKNLNKWISLPNFWGPKSAYQTGVVKQIGIPGPSWSHIGHTKPTKASLIPN